MPNDSTNPLLDSLKDFDNLPTVALVRQPVVEVLFACSSTSVWRNVKSGRIPQPVKVSAGVTAWRVGDLRAALAALA
ncbi:MAG: transcriptional regulator [Burkholderia sp.]|jgi:predicted DNA-binding transcriptional regulator AlpA|uniref:helix-turn-helix transcriptional regulator n=1 Tax=Burkholderia sp. TaxID=36773 RepID=UPI002586E113|nr:transcriptional regulator [Burkholderia sp.]MCA3642794.1 transcriptional regulator [Methylobacterium sp.]MCA3781413.1 transcriptional regulator [Burkholderia sp.]MCA3795505.1 transcriptional regulator [Burkholderia sp.]MCA3802249.1 transcriptional regulator [Burkholderia sp.]MCA3808407.1 transcriptional regulator [Burkholderia sp.]